jgi:OOP family OmpA-OmpF porin
MQRAWTIQLIGLLAVILLLAFTFPHFAQRLPERIASHAQQRLHEQGMSWASVQAEDRNVVIRGSTPHTSEQQQAVQTLQSLWYVQNVENATLPHIVEPYTMHIQWDGNTLSLNGYVSNDDTKAALAGQIKSAFGHAAELAEVQTGAGAPKGWETIIGNTLLAQIKPLKTASIRMTDQAVNFSGKASTTREIEALKKALEPLQAQGYDISLNMVALDNAAIVCQQEFNRLLTQENIVFSSGGSSIDSKSDTLLQALADAAIFCAHSTILISGHTDDVGSEETNLKLSEQRAKAVKGWLFNQGGVPLERLKTAGKGSSEPLVNNDTEANRAKNRRIEFIVEGI